MARYQYQLNTIANWQSSFGNAIVGLVNKSGSGRRFVVRRFGVQVQSFINQTNAPFPVELRRGTTVYGSLLQPHAAHDSSTALPSDVSVVRDAATDATTTIFAYGAMRAAGIITGSSVWPSIQRGIGAKLNQVLGTTTRAATSPVEPIVVAAGEIIALVPFSVNASGVNSPVRVSVVLLVNGKSYTWEYTTFPTPGIALFAVANASGSAEVVKLASITMDSTGTTDTPYLRVVPVGQVYADYVDDATRQLNNQILRRNSTAPAWDSAWGNAYADVPFVPFGVPENYLTETTTGTPRGFNYLHTKDFNGPMYQAFFPEMRQIFAGNADCLCWNQYSDKGASLGMEGLTINEGEGIALVGSAETATSGATFSGWPALRFHLTFDVESITTVAVSVVDPDLNPIENVLVRVMAAETAGTLTAGDEIDRGYTDTNGQYTTTIDYEAAFGAALDVTIRCRKSTSAPFYRAQDIPASVPVSGYSSTVQMILDQ